MTAYRNEIIKDNYVEDANLQLSSFQDLNMGKKIELGFLEENPPIQAIIRMFGMQD